MSCATAAVSFPSLTRPLFLFASSPTGPVVRRRHFFHGAWHAVAMMWRLLFGCMEAVSYEVVEFKLSKVILKCLLDLFRAKIMPLE